jgi:hypothetical protein
MQANRYWILLATLFCLGGFSDESFGQAECYAWGGLRGIRVDGELMAFTTGVRAVSPESTPLAQRNLERLANPRFSRDGARQICSGSLSPGSSSPVGGFRGREGGGGGVNGRVAYEDVGPGIVNVDVQVTATADTALAGTYFYIHFPGTEYSGASAKLIDATLPTQPPAENRHPGGSARGVRFTSPRRQLEVNFTAPEEIVVQLGGGQNGGIDAYFPISTGNLTNGQTAHLSFTLKASGAVDKSPVKLVIDSEHPGSAFDGVGGNFRIQNRTLDPPQVQYNLDHLRVAWGRVNLPLDQWQPNEDSDPLQVTNASQLNASVREAMEMARTLAQRKIPIVISLWGAPRWALAPPVPRPDKNGQTSHLNPDKWDAVSRSIGAYLEFLKREYCVEPRLFSFNESDLGYNVLQTPQEHADAIKQLGAYFAARGLATRMLLGDTGDPTGTNFINAAMQDVEAVKYLGAVSYHSWRGGTVEQYTRWGEAAKKLKLPLLIAEGGTDSDAYRYPALMLEPWYALNEIGMYVDICRYSQPLAILEWQLTENYSVLTGGANGQPLQPAQRFWQLKQLELTPIGAAALPITCDKAGVAACAYGDATGGDYTLHLANISLNPDTIPTTYWTRGTYALHLVNTGPTRTTNISGFTAGVKALRVYVTDARRGMKEMDPIVVAGGTARLVLDAMSYTTLISGDSAN